MVVFGDKETTYASICFLKGMLCFICHKVCPICSRFSLVYLHATKERTFYVFIRVININFKEFPI